MRLLTWDDSNHLSLTKDLSDNDGIPPYAILSHTWGEDSEEVTFVDIENNLGQEKAGYEKIEFCGDQARKDGLQFFWVDTCCINKNNHVELSEAITSMFRWYKNATKCYVYLSDVSTQSAWQASFQNSRWFRRGWTLQELLAPTVVEFFSYEEDLLGTKATLAERIHQITTIPLAALCGTSLSQFPVAERFRWTELRETKKKEDMAYCLLGIFDVYMTFNYGEGDNALRRLQKKINSRFGADVAGALTQPCPTRSLRLCLNSAPLINPSDFFGRTAEIDAMSRILRPGEPSTEQRRVVLGGMGGIGKTQLAIAFARRYEHSYSSILWLNATSESTLHLSLRSILQSLIAADELEKLDNGQVSARVLEWLSYPQHTRWLLIFDNYDEPDNFDIDTFCPNIGQGSIIITTRLPDLVSGQQVRLKPLYDMDDCLDILQVRSRRRDVRNDEGAHSLAKRLEGLPLALVTAGSYLRRSTISFQQYLLAYEQRWNIDHQRPLRLQEYQNRTLYTTWDLLYTRLATDNPNAAQLLRLLAYFDNQSIWYELLAAGAAKDLPLWLQQTLSEPILFNNVMYTLVEYCFAEIQTASQSYCLHSCIHDWLLANLNRNLDPQSYWYAFDCVDKSMPCDAWNWLKNQRYGPLASHAVRLAHQRFCQDQSLYCNKTSRIVGAVHIGRLLTVQLRFTAAERILWRALAGAENSLGPDHALTLDTVSCLAFLYSDQGQLDKAEQMFQRALTGYQNRPQAKNISEFKTITGLGLVYRAQGRLDEADQMLQRALAGQVEALGPGHLATLRTLGNLGNLYWSQDNLVKAEQMYLRALDGFQKLQTSDVVSISTAYQNLGIVYRRQNKLDKAEQMHLRALAGKTKTLKSDHPSVIDTVWNLASLYRAQDRLAEAEQMYIQGLTASLKRYGPDNRNTFRLRDELAELYRLQGRTDEASL